MTRRFRAHGETPVEATPARRIPYRRWALDKVRVLIGGGTLEVWPGICKRRGQDTLLAAGRLAQDGGDSVAILTALTLGNGAADEDECCSCDKCNGSQNTNNSYEKGVIHSQKAMLSWKKKAALDVLRCVAGNNVSIWEEREAREKKGIGYQIVVIINLELS